MNLLDRFNTDDKKKKLLLWGGALGIIILVVSMLVLFSGKSKFYRGSLAPGEIDGLQDLATLKQSAQTEYEEAETIKDEIENDFFVVAQKRVDAIVTHADFNTMPEYVKSKSTQSKTAREEIKNDLQGSFDTAWQKIADAKAVIDATQESEIVILDDAKVALKKMIEIKDNELIPTTTEIKNQFQQKKIFENLTYAEKALKLYGFCIKLGATVNDSVPSFSCTYGPGDEITPTDDGINHIQLLITEKENEKNICTDEKLKDKVEWDDQTKQCVDKNDKTKTYDKSELDQLIAAHLVDQPDRAQQEFESACAANGTLSPDKKVCTLRDGLKFDKNGPLENAFSCEKTPDNFALACDKQVGCKWLGNTCSWDPRKYAGDVAKNQAPAAPEAKPVNEADSFEKICTDHGGIFKDNICTITIHGTERQYGDKNMLVNALKGVGGLAPVPDPRKEAPQDENPRVAQKKPMRAEKPADVKNDKEVAPEDPSPPPEKKPAPPINDNKVNNDVPKNAGPVANVRIPDDGKSPKLATPQIACSNPADLYDPAKKVCVPKSTESTETPNDAKEVAVKTPTKTTGVKTGTVATGSTGVSSGQTIAPSRGVSANGGASPYAASSGGSLHGAYIQGKTGPGLVIYPVAVLLANAGLWAVRGRKNK